MIFLIVIILFNLFIVHENMNNNLDLVVVAVETAGVCCEEGQKWIYAIGSKQLKNLEKTYLESTLSSEQV